MIGNRLKCAKNLPNQPFVMSQIAKCRVATGTESNGLNRIFTNKWNCEKTFGAPL